MTLFDKVTFFWRSDTFLGAKKSGPSAEVTNWRSDVSKGRECGEVRFGKKLIKNSKK